MIGIENHEWNDGVAEAPSTCDTSGKIVYTCKTCGYKKTESLPATGHSFRNGGQWESDSDTHWHYCLNEKTKVDEGQHSWDKGHVEKAATCVNEGVIVYTCTTCGKMMPRTIAKKDHRRSADWECDEDGIHHWTKCLDCGQQFDYGTHTFSTSYVTKEPTCEEEGTLVKVCSVCGNYVKSDIAPLGHSAAAKWTRDDTNHWHKCENGCGEKLDLQEHTFGDWGMYLDSTCTTKGLEMRVCSVCGKAEYRSIDATGHDIDTEHFEHDENKHWHECENCDGKFNAEEHTLTAQETVAPTATEYGYTLYRCEECGYEVKKDFVDPLGE